MTQDLIAIGRVVGTHGVRGEVTVQILTDFPDRFENATEALLRPKEGGAPKRYAIEGCRFHKGRALLRMGGIHTPEAAGALRGSEFVIPKDQVRPLPEGAYYHFQIVGLAVESAAGAPLGTVTDIIETGSNDVYVVTGSAGTHLVPALKSVIRKVDLDARRLVVDLPAWE